MKLSILDQSPISSGQTAKDALEESVKLAQLGDYYGYTRYWIAEHHDLPGLACSVPEVMLGIIGANTKKIRIGSGAVLLPHYKPYKVAEIFNMLATLFPNRVDIGIGRSPGGSAEATNALNDNFLQKVYKMSDLVDELLHFFHQDFQNDHPLAKVTASPTPEVQPDVWMLGTSEKSAILAAQNGLSYAFGQFMSDMDMQSILQSYREKFTPKKPGHLPQLLVTVPVVCAITKEKAEEIAYSTLIWQLMTNKGQGKTIPTIKEARNYKLTEKEHVELLNLKQRMIIGDPKEVYTKLQYLQTKYQVDEIMILTITHSPEDRANSYKLIAQVALS